MFALAPMVLMLPTWHEYKMECAHFKSGRKGFQMSVIFINKRKISIQQLSDTIGSFILIQFDNNIRIQRRPKCF